MKSRPTKVRLKGFDSRSLQAFELFFMEECNKDFEVTDLTLESDISIIDIDVCIIHHEIEEMREQNPDQGIIAISLLPRSSKDELLRYLRKPIVVSEFKSYLYRMRELIQAAKENSGFDNNIDVIRVAHESNEDQKATTKLSKLTVAVDNSQHKEKAELSEDTPRNFHLEAAKYVGKNSDVDLHSAQAFMKVVYNPEHKLQGALELAIQHAKKYAKPVELTCLNVGFIVDISKNAIYAAVGESAIKSLCTMNVERLEAPRKLEGDYSGQRLFAMARQPMGELKRWNISALMWKVALWCSKGKIPRETDINLPVFLANWPNFSRLVCFPYAMNIAAVLIKKPMRLSEVARHLNIPQRYVFGFYSAAHSLGLANTSKRKSDYLFDVDSGYQAVENSEFAVALFKFLRTNDGSRRQKLA